MPRALPDADACAHEWAALRPAALAALARRQLNVSPSASSAAWSSCCGNNAPSSGQAEHKREAEELDALVRRFRRLREGLTACSSGSGGGGRDQVFLYELSCDIAAAAGDTAECLKCLQALANTVYPAAEEAVTAAAGAAGARGRSDRRASAAAAAAKQQSAWDDDDGDNSGGGTDGGNPPAANIAAGAATSTTAAVLARRAEVHAALLVWFVCVPARPVHAEVAKRLRATPPGLLAAPEVQLGLAAASAVLRGNAVRAARCYAAAPPLVRFALAAGARGVQGRAARAVAAAYRSLPRGALAALVGLSGAGGGADADAPLRAALEAARDTLGSRGASTALADFDAGADQLRFRG